MIRTVIGVIAGIVATGPMTAAMLALHRRLPEQEQYELPPGEIVTKVAEKSGAQKIARKPEVKSTLISHFGYGAVTGAIYSNIERKLPGSPTAKGVAFGLAVWSVSYLGMLPAIGILRSAEKHPARRNGLMIASHLVWGISLARFVALLVEESQRLSQPEVPLNDAVTG